MKIAIIAFITVIVVAAGAYLLLRNPGEIAPEVLTPAENGNNQGIETDKSAIQTIAVQEVAQGFVSPIAFVSPLDGTGRMFLVDQTGVVKIVDSLGEVRDGNFLDLRGRMVGLNRNYDERGLLGLAFHPEFGTNGRFFVYYSAPLQAGAPRNFDHTSILSEFAVSENDQNAADPDSELVILKIDQPQSNHNAGHITFGLDGYLYVPLGDGGGANDTGAGHPPLGNGQDTTTLLGSILRLDIDGGDPYAIPEDNPLAGENGRREIFAYGFRNPYGVSFDQRGANELFAADVGQNTWEEINIVKGGNNYGWHIREGRHCFDPENPDNAPAICPDAGAGGEALENPIIEYQNANHGGLGFAAVGGYVYRSEAISGLEGKYIFGDWSRSFSAGDGTLFAAYEADGGWSFQELRIANRANGRLGMYIRGFGQDENNELYILASGTAGPNGQTGAVYKIVSAFSE